MNIGDVFLTLRADGAGFGASVEKAAVASAAKSGKTFNQSFSAAVKQGIGLGAGFGVFQAVSTGIHEVIGAIEGSISAAISYNTAMKLLETQTGASAAEVEKMKTAVLGLAPVVGTGPEELAKGLYHIESSGIRGAQALDILKTAAEGAKVGQADLESVTNALLAAVNSGVGGVSDMSQAMGVLNGVVGAGNMRMEELTGALATGVLSAAKTFGVSIQSVGAALADMTRQGIPAEEAATRLRMTLSLLGAPTKKAATELSSIGLSATDLADAMRGPDGILGAVTLLRQKLDASGLSATAQAALLSKAFGGGKTSAGIMTLIGNVTMLKDTQEQVNASTGGFADAWAATSDEAQFKIDKANAALDSLRIVAGENLMPVIGDLAQAFADMLGGVKDAEGPIGEMEAHFEKLAANAKLLTPALADVVKPFGQGDKTWIGLLNLNAHLDDLFAMLPGAALQSNAWKNSLQDLGDQINLTGDNLGHFVQLGVDTGLSYDQIRLSLARVVLAQTAAKDGFVDMADGTSAATVAALKKNVQDFIDAHQAVVADMTDPQPFQEAAFMNMDAYWSGLQERLDSKGAGTGKFDLSGPFGDLMLSVQASVDKFTPVINSLVGEGIPKAIAEKWAKSAPTLQEAFAFMLTPDAATVDHYLHVATLVAGGFADAQAEAFVTLQENAKAARDKVVAYLGAIPVLSSQKFRDGLGLIQSAMAEYKLAITEPASKAKELAAIQADLTSKKVRDGLKSHNPAIRKDTQDLVAWLKAKRDELNGTVVFTGTVIAGVLARDKLLADNYRNRYGHRASGGAVGPGWLGWVGEQGPELLAMGTQGGAVISHLQSMALASRRGAADGLTMPLPNGYGGGMPPGGLLSGSTTSVVNVHVDGLVRAETPDDIGRALRRIGALGLT